MPWFCENRGAIQSASKVGFPGRTRHADIALKCTREYIENDLVGVSYVPSSSQLADVFTKRIHKPLMEKKFMDSTLFVYFSGKGLSSAVLHGRTQEGVCNCRESGTVWYDMVTMF